MTYNLPESVSIKKWSLSRAPRRLLVIRIQALGDMFIMLPFIAGLKEKYPGCQIDLLVREDYALLPSKMKMFDRIYPLKGGRSAIKQKLCLVGLLPRFIARNYDIVLDLQRSSTTRWLRRILLPKAWTEFDRLSPKSASSRYQWSIEQLGIGNINANYSFSEDYMYSGRANKLLKKYGWNGKNNLVILNPAAAFITRNWEVTRYVDFIKLWLSRAPNTQFVFLGVDKIKKKATFIKQQLPKYVIDIVNKTDLATAYSIVLKAGFMLTEDSGLGHLSWVSGKKTLVLLGASRSDWASPSGVHTACFDSSDLPCGDCMLAQCIHSNIICMDRLTPEKVYSKAWELYNRDLGAPIKLTTAPLEEL